MILLVATRLDIIGRFLFPIDVDGVEHTRTRDAIKAAKILFDLGVDGPLQLIDHSPTAPTMRCMAAISRAGIRHTTGGTSWPTAARAIP